MTTDTGVLIVDDPIFRLDLREQLQAMRYLVLGEAGDAQRAITLACKLKPDLVIRGIQLPGEMDSISAAEVLTGAQVAAVWLLTHFSNIELAQRVAEAGVTGYLLKPFSEDMLLLAIHVALVRFRQLQSLQQEVLELRGERESRQICKQAAELLMREYNLTNEEALSRIRTAGKTTHSSQRAVAEAIILAIRSGQNEQHSGSQT
jgi:two-component system, response regulator PdtaR